MRSAVRVTTTLPWPRFLGKMKDGPPRMEGVEKDFQHGARTSHDQRRTMNSPMKDPTRLRWVLAWSAAWFVFALILVVRQTFLPVSHPSWRFLPEIGFAWLIGVLPIPRRGVLIACVSLIALMVTIGLVSVLRQAHEGPRLAMASGTQNVSSRGSSTPQTFTKWRSWRIPPDTASLALSLDARLDSGPISWDWLSGSQGKDLSWIHSGDTWFTRFSPGGVHPFIYRGADLGAPLAGHRFRALVRGRVTEGDSSCGTLSLVERGNAYGEHRAVCFGKMWSTASIDWIAPRGASKTLIDVVLNGFHDTQLLLGTTEIEVKMPVGWKRLGPLAPEGLGIQFKWTSAGVAHSRRFQLVPDSAWTTHAFRLADPSLSRARIVAVSLRPEREASFSLRDVALKAGPAAIAATPVAVFRPRSSLGLSDPNLAGHSLTTMLVAALVQSPPLWSALAAILLALAGIALTGSRTAWLVATVASLVWLAIGLDRRSRRAGLFVAGSIIAAISIGMALGFFGRVSASFSNHAPSELSRVEIWGAAVSALKAHPWTGLEGTGETFSDYVRAWTHTAFDVTHAHDLWLQYGATYGVLGLGAIAWLSLSLMLIAWQWGRWRGLYILTAVYLLNTADFTFFYVGVLVPLIAALGSLRRHPTRASD